MSGLLHLITTATETHVWLSSCFKSAAPSTSPHQQHQAPLRSTDSTSPSQLRNPEHLQGSTRSSETVSPTRASSIMELNEANLTQLDKATQPRNISYRDLSIELRQQILSHLLKSGPFNPHQLLTYIRQLRALGNVGFAFGRDLLPVVKQHDNTYHNGLLRVLIDRLQVRADRRTAGEQTSPTVLYECS